MKNNYSSNKKTNNKPVVNGTNKKKMFAHFWLYFVISILIAFVANEFLTRNNTFDDASYDVAYYSEVYIKDYLVDEKSLVSNMSSEDALTLKSEGLPSDFTDKVTSTSNTMNIRVTKLTDIKFYWPSSNRKFTSKNATSLYDVYLDYATSFSSLELISSNGDTKEYLNNIKIKELAFYSVFNEYTGHIKNYSTYKRKTDSTLNLNAKGSNENTSLAFF